MREERRERMSRLLIAAMCAGFVLPGVVSILAQDNNLPAVPKRRFKHNARIISVYDEAKKLTVVRTQWFGVTEGIMNPRSMEAGAVSINDRNNARYAGKRDTLEIDVGFAYPGRVLTSTPEAVEFQIRVAYRGVSLFKGGEMPELIAVKDGENISLGKTSLVSSKTMVEVEEGQMSYEWLFARFNYPGLLRFVNAKSVMMKVGQLEFKLVDRDLEALRDLASRMTP
jgi:hypothetical protein